MKFRIFKAQSTTRGPIQRDAPEPADLATALRDAQRPVDRTAHLTAAMTPKAVSK